MGNKPPSAQAESPRNTRSSLQFNWYAGVTYIERPKIRRKNKFADTQRGIFPAQKSRPQLRGSPPRFHADPPQLMFGSLVWGNSARFLCVITALYILPRPIPFPTFLNSLPALPKVATAFPRILCFLPRRSVFLKKIYIFFNMFLYFVSFLTSIFFSSHQ